MLSHMDSRAHQIGRPPRWSIVTTAEHQCTKEVLAERTKFLMSYPLKHLPASDDPEIKLAYRFIPPPSNSNLTETDSATTNLEDVEEVAIIIMQGYNETMEKYSEVVYDLRERMFASSVRPSFFLMDYRNQGVSGRESKIRCKNLSRLAYMSDWKKWILDMEDFMTKVVHPTTTKRNHKICVVAHSTGCLITAHVAARHPDWFHSITLSAPFFRLKIHQRILGSLEIFKLPFKFLCDILGIGVRPLVGSKVLATKNMVLDEKTKVSHNRARCEWWHEIRTTKNPSGCVALTLTYRWLHEAIQCYSQLPAILPLLQCPVAIVPADQEHLVSNEATYEFASLIPDSTIVQPCSGCYHEIWMEDDQSRSLLLETCVQNITRTLGAQQKRLKDNLINLKTLWKGEVAKRIVYQSKGSTTLLRDRAYAVRSVSFPRLIGVVGIAMWLVRFIIQRLSQTGVFELLKPYNSNNRGFLLAVAILTSLKHFWKPLVAG